MAPGFIHSALFRGHERAHGTAQVVNQLEQGPLLAIVACRGGPQSPQAVWKLPQLSNLLIVEIVAGAIMKRFIEGEARTQVTLLPECLDDYVAENVRGALSMLDKNLDFIRLGIAELTVSG